MSRLLQTKGNKITSRFGPRTLTYTSGALAGQTVTKQHNGIDIVGTGSTLDYIVAHTAGVVVNAGLDTDVGYFAQIETAPGVLMVYYHMAKGTLAVQKGDKVERGEVLGYMGATGNVTGAHLHFGIRDNGVWIDPEPYLDVDYGEEDNMLTYEQWKEYMARYRAELAQLPPSEGWGEDGVGDAVSAGVSDGTRPRDLATREEVMAMVTRANPE